MNIKVNKVALFEGYRTLTDQYVKMEQILEQFEKEKFLCLDLEPSKEREELELFLRQQEKKMGQQLEFLRKLRLALEQVINCYEKGEISIYDRLEENKKEYPKVRIQKIETAKIRDILFSLKV